MEAQTTTPQAQAVQAQAMAPRWGRCRHSRAAAVARHLAYLIFRQPAAPRLPTIEICLMFGQCAACIHSEDLPTRLLDACHITPRIRIPSSRIAGLLPLIIP